MCTKPKGDGKGLSKRGKTAGSFTEGKKGPKGQKKENKRNGGEIEKGYGRGKSTCHKRQETRKWVARK